MSALETPPSLTRTVLRGVGLAGAGHVLTQALTLGVYLALARLATPQDFGRFAAGSVVVGLGILVAESGMLAAVIQRRDRVDEAAATALVATVSGGILLGLAALAASPLVGYFFHSHEIGLVAAAMSGFVVLKQTMVVPDAVMQRRFSFVRRVILEPLRVVVFGATAIAATAVGLGVWGLVAGTYAGVAAQAVTSWLLVRWRPRLELVSFAMWRELARFGRHVIASDAVRLVNAESQTALIGRVLGTAMLGQWTYAFRIALQPLALIVESVAYVLMPAFSRISHDEERFRAAVLRSLRWISMVALPASLILLPLGRPLVAVLFGPRWHEAGRAVTAMCAACAGAAVVSLASEAWKAAGRPDWLPRTHVLGGVLSIALTAAFLPVGLIGVAGGFSIASTLTAAYALYGLGRVTGAPVGRLLDQLWPATAAASVMAAAVYVLERELDAGSHGTAVGLALLAAETLAGLAVYLGALTVVSPGTGRALVGAARTARSRFRAAAAPLP
jgi:O-antigen/teichoic acid export membrane protein